MILFGVRSPIAVEYEEGCLAAGIEISACVIDEGAPRVVAAEKVVPLDRFREQARGGAFLACAFSPLRREEWVARGIGCGLTLAKALVHPSAVVASSVRLGDGSFVNAGAIIGAASILGEAVLVNRSASLGHHALLADYVSIGPGATLAGNVRVGRGAVVGAGAVILPNIRVGAGAVVAAGSVVRRHVPDGMLAAGNPAVERVYDMTRSSLNKDGAE